MFHRHPFLSLLTGAYLVFLAWLTLTPMPIDAHREELIVRLLEGLHRHGYVESMGYQQLEHLANIALFVPVGVFLLILFGAGGWWLALLSCFAMTVGIEYAQHYIPGRVPDSRDISANTLGAAIGVAVGLVLTLPSTLRRRQRRRYAMP